ncbi:MAG: histidine kinase [Chryseobacterium sp.]|uniref:tetratricopeptide repeat-containing sensor histidine kinase n=1 Tax=Chryseobacterium sp. TaxID=1871047 RepID=UPI00282E384C|nr:ATP-binding protein [Chryseobacterium sp.]MDR2238796.1 histidine kinase [Chryseobacterium sp.]
MSKIQYLLCFVICFPLYAQELFPLNEKKYTDSLQQVIRQNPDGFSKAEAYYILSDYYRNTDSLLSRKYLESGRKSGAKDPFTAALYYYFEGQYNLDQSKEKAAASYQKSIGALAAFKTKKADFYQSLCWYSYGITRKNKEGYPYLIKTMLEKSIPITEKYGDSKMLGFLYTQLALMLTYNAEFQKAEQYNSKAREILEKNAPGSTELFYAYLSTSGNYCYQAKGSVGKKFLNQAGAMIRPYPESSANSSYYYNKALYFISQQQHESALETIEKGLAYTKKFRQKLLMQMFYFHQYDTFKKLKRYQEAKNLLEEILADQTLGTDISNRKTIYSHLSNINEMMGNPAQALIWEKKYSKLSDSLNTENVKVEINELESKFNASEKEKKIALLNAEKNQQQMEVNKKNYYLWGLSLVLLFFVLLLFFLFIIYRNNKKLSEQKEINLQQKIEDIKQKEELMLTKAVLEGEERERERVAKDLHDGLGGMLAGVKINLSTWSSAHLDPEQHKDFYKILHQLDHSVAELRHVARNLMPESLLNFGLETALNDLCEFYTRNDLEICFQPIGIEKELPLTIQLNIYRIVQELLANAVKHAGASSILLQCSQSGETFLITIEDNGKGFEKNVSDNTRSMGFRNLKNRVHYMRGKMEISSDHQGTTINIELNTHGE